MIDLRNHYGFTRTPFGKDLAPSMLHHYPGHAEAVARITWCARERAVAVITGEVGAGKTVAARAAIAGLDQTRHTLIYLADPTTGTRGIHHTVVTALGGRPAPSRPPSASVKARSRRRPSASSTVAGPSAARSPKISVADAGIVPGEESGSLTTR